MMSKNREDSTAEKKKKAHKMQSLLELQTLQTANLTA